MQIIIHLQRCFRQREVKKKEAKRKKKLMKRMYMIKEWITSEGSYIHKLKALVEQVINPLEALVNTKEEIITKQEIMQLFPYVPQILHLNEGEFLNAMR